VNITFKVQGKPVQQGSMRAFNNRIVHHNSAELTAWRNKVAATGLAAGLTPVEDAVMVSLRFFYERGKTVSRALPTVPPDLDKQIRSILDALTGVAYIDDSQVVAINATKEYGQAGVIITVESYQVVM
jgi:Holliday junction resolvase RusA-like endonuclease